MTRVVDSGRRRVIGLAAVLWSLATLTYFGAEAYAAAAIPGYSYAADYISVLGVPSASPHAALVNAAFFVQGVLFFAAAVLVVVGLRARGALWFITFAAAHAVGNVLVGAVPSAPGGGPPAHAVGATLAIAGGNAAVLAGAALIRRSGGSKGYRNISIVLAVVGLLCLLAISAPALHTVVPVGVWERISVYTVLVWQLGLAGYLIRSLHLLRVRHVHVEQPGVQDGPVP